jgi:PAS domain S-box-containing protein
VPQPETEVEEFFDLSIDPLSIIGFDGEFKRVNASFLRLTGYTKPKLFSGTAFDIVHPDDAERTREALAQLAEGHDVVRFEGRVICADGAARWLEWSTRSMPERGVVYSVGRDTTERRRVEPSCAGRALTGQSDGLGARRGAGGAAAGGDARCSRPPSSGCSARSRRSAVFQRRFLGMIRYGT